ncbi:hypothetical protein LTR85_004597 [Meristemomyces frigidus]|nr:hypothetical protein LTR85_004597 [Meristemomyces frigidus]
MADLQHVHPSRRAPLTDTSTSSQQNQNAQPASQAGGLFGASTQTSQPQQSGGLFGNTQTSQPQQGGGLFGSTLGGQTSQPQQQSSLFGNTTTQLPQQQSSLFGNTTTQQPQQQSGGLFGNTNTQQQQQQGGGGLFGSSTMPASQPQATSGLFSSLNQQPAQQSTLFGNTQGTSLFGNQPDNQRMTGNSFYHAQNPQNRPGNPSVFGLNAVPADQLPSLLQASQFNMSQSQRRTPYHGSLTMGQAGNQQQQTATVGAVKVNVSELRGTTRFQDCVDEVKSDFEKADAMVQKQEQFCREIQAVLAKHSEEVDSIDPDVVLVKEKADAVEAVLASDAQAVERSRKVVEADRKDFARIQRVVENQKLPSGYQVPNANSGRNYGGYDSQQLRRLAQTPGDEGDIYDTDLIGNYFLPMAAELQQTLNSYASNLAEIEAHMKVMEGSAVAQAQQLAAKRAGMSGGGAAASGEQTVRELADTLRGFEQSILGVAGTVGQCREGVNELVLGRLGETLGGGGAADRSKRPW